MRLSLVKRARVGRLLVCALACASAGGTLGCSNKCCKPTSKWRDWIATQNGTVVLTRSEDKKLLKVEFTHEDKVGVTALVSAGKVTLFPTQWLRDETPPWLLVDGGWIYITGETPTVATNTVTAGAEASTLIQCQLTNSFGATKVRSILIETQGKKPGKVKVNSNSKNFANDSPSYIDAYPSGTIDNPKTFKMPDLTQPMPTGFDAELWNELTTVDGWLKSQGKTWPTGTVGH